MKTSCTTGYMFFVLAILTLQSCQTIPKNAAPVQPFSTERYLGKWYEIARFDYRFEKNLNNVTATYSKNDDGSIKVDNRGYDTEEKKWKQSVGKAKLAGKPDEGRLKVSFFGPFYSGYNVVAIDKEYKYALVAGKNLDYLWLLSRETTMPNDVKDDYVQRAQKIGYDTRKLIWVKHDR